MGNFGFQDLLFLLVLMAVLIGLPAFFYFLGKRAGYRKAQLDLYRKMEGQRTR
jgi:hypothetical protein